MTDSPTTPRPPLGTALRRGFSGRCPACGAGRLFSRFLKPVTACTDCAHDWSELRADDFPAYLAIFIVGHLLIPVMVEVNLSWTISMPVQMILWPVLAAAGALALIQPLKGAVLALLWTR